MNTATNAQLEQEQSDKNKNNNQINEVFAQQSAFALTLRSSTFVQRKETLLRLLDVFEKHIPEIIEAGQKDFNKPETEVMLAEIFPVVHEIKHTLKHLKKWMKPKKVSATKVTFGTKSKVVPEPKGVCLIISPWNYPINLTFGPLVSAIAAGNTAMIKPSEMTPYSAKVISKIVDACFDKKEVAVFEGEVDIATALLQLPFDHTFFTGSPAVGKAVMAASAKHLTSVTLELGGKSPVVVDSSADLKKSAGKIAWGKFSNNGQTCIAPDYVLVQEEVRDEFVKEMTLAVKRAYGDSAQAIKQNPDYCRIVNIRHTQRIRSLVDGALEHNGKIVLGGDIDVEDRFVAPTLVVGKQGDEDFLHCKLMQEEIFGPVLPIVPYRSLDEAIARINAMSKPLALYVYSKKQSNIEQVLTQTSSGGACVNHSVIHFMHNNLPFGGVNNSGIGNSHGEYGFKAFSHERAILVDKFTSNQLLFPPYTDKVKKLVKQIMKFAS